MASSAVLQAIAIPPHPSSSTSHSSSSSSFSSARKTPFHPLHVAYSGLRRPPSSSPLSLSAKPQHCIGVGTSNREKIPKMPKSASIVAFAGMLQHFPRNQHHQGSFALRCNEGQFVSFLGGRGQSMKKSRSVVVRVIPFQRGDARQQPPPDLPSYLFKNRIIFLGMSLVPSVTELIMAELLYLQYDDPSKPVYMYINSTGTTKDGEKLGYDTEAFAIYDTMRYVKPPIFTLCVGNAWGEAALLLSAGSKGNRSALPSSTIMIKQPISQFRGQATDIDIARREVRNVKNELVSLLSKHTGHSKEKIEEDIRRPKYFSPEEAVEYGIIDKVLYSEKGKEEKGVVADLRKAQLL